MTLSAAACLACSVCFTSTAAAQSYPAKPLRLIVPFVPGGANDIMARSIAPEMSAILGQQIIVDNRGGASGQIGAEAVANSPPDGYTLMLASNSVTSHLVTELFALSTGIRLLVVPYKGGGPAVVDLLGGHVDGRIDQIPSSMAHIQAKRVRAIAVTTARRAELLPGVPTLIESGVPGFDASTVIGIFAPAGTPNEIVQRLNAALNKALANPAVLERFASQGAEARPGTSEDLGKFVREDMAKWKKVVQQAKLQAD